MPTFDVEATSTSTNILLSLSCTPNFWSVSGLNPILTPPKTLVVAAGTTEDIVPPEVTLMLVPILTAPKTLAVAVGIVEDIAPLESMLILVPILTPPKTLAVAVGSE